MTDNDFYRIAKELGCSENLDADSAEGICRNCLLASFLICSLMLSVNVDCLIFNVTTHISSAKAEIANNITIKKIFFILNFCQFIPTLRMCLWVKVLVFLVFFYVWIITIGLLSFLNINTQYNGI